MKKKQKVREHFREVVFKRDKNKCVMCGKSGNEVKLDAHHITDRGEMPGGGYVLENGISLCDTEEGCHIKAEKYHISEGKEWVEGFHPNDLYKKINSNFKLAYEKSLKLEEN